MKTYRCIVQLLLLCPVAAPGPLVAQTPEADKRDIVDQIRHSYYNLAAQGLLELHCRATPDWTAVYKQVSVDTEHDKLLPLVKGTHFDVSIGSSGASAVSHQYDIAPPDEQTADQLRKTTSGAEQMLTGFFQTWYPLMFNFSVLKNGSYLDMEKIDDGYRFTGQHDSTRLIMVFTPDSD